MSVVLVERSASLSDRAAVEPVLQSAPFQLGAMIEADSVDPGVRGLIARLPDPRARGVLEQDIAALVRAYLAVCGEAHARVQLELLRRDACRRFHDDHLPLRLLCTYAGPGTEWVDDAHVDAAALSAVGGDIQRANARIVPDPAHVRRARPWHALLLKGGRYPGRTVHGAVHRSPPIEARGLARLVLRIDSELSRCDDARCPPAAIGCATDVAGGV